MNEVNKSLKMGVNRGCKFTLNFRMDIFIYLFNGKFCPHMVLDPSTVLNTLKLCTSQAAGKGSSTNLVMVAKSAFHLE